MAEQIDFLKLLGGGAGVGASLISRGVALLRAAFAVVSPAARVQVLRLLIGGYCIECGYEKSGEKCGNCPHE